MIRRRRCTKVVEKVDEALDRAFLDSGVLLVAHAGEDVLHDRRVVVDLYLGIELLNHQGGRREDRVPQQRVILCVALPVDHSDNEKLEAT